MKHIYCKLNGTELVMKSQNLNPMKQFGLMDCTIIISRGGNL